MDKIKNLACFRFISFVVSLSILIILSTFLFCVTASAEQIVISDMTAGTIANYTALQLPITSTSSYVPLSKISSKSGDSSKVAITGKCESGYKVISTFSIVTDGSNNCTINGNAFLKDGMYRGNPATIDNFALQMWYELSDKHLNLWYQVAYRSDESKPYAPYVGWNGSIPKSFSISDYYLIFGAYSNNSDEFVNDIENNISADTDFVIVKEPKADFITFPKTSNNLGLLPIYLKSWLGDGYQYPYLEFYVDSNTHKQSYTLSISSADVDLYDRHKGMFQGVDHGSHGLDKYTGPYYGTGNLVNDLRNISNALDLVPDVPVNPSWSADTTTAFQKDALIVILKSRIKSNVSFGNSVDIVTEAMNFTGSDDIIRYYSICLSDYIDISHNKIYRVDISNGLNTLATTYFASYDDFKRNSTPVGDSFSVGYTDRSSFDNDASNGTYVSGTRFELNAFNNNDTPSISPNTNLYNNIGNGDFFTALDSTLKGLQGFFYGCYAIIPPAIISIILGSLAIIVVMRVLGR